MEKMGELLERLVSDLPGLGGWPKWADECILHRGSCKAMFYDGAGRFQGYPSFPDIKFKEEALVERVVYREMYEAAVSSSKPEWDGEGLPPVNLLCEWRDDTCTECKWVKGYLRAQINTETGIVLVIEPAGGYALEWRGPCVKFRPIRSEADKKRDEAISALKQFKPQLVGELAGYLYDDIAAGKIPHIRTD